MIDVIGCKIGLSSSFKMYVYVVYIPPKMPVHVIELFVELFEDLNSSSSQIFIVGDFNIPFDIFVSPETDCNSKQNFIRNLTEFLNLQQLNKIPNCDERMLDLVMSDIHCSVDKCDNCLVPEDKYHPGLDIIFSLRQDKSCPFVPDFKFRNYNFKKANFELMYELFFDTNWSAVYNCEEVNLACSKFYELIY